RFLENPRATAARAGRSGYGTARVPKMGRPSPRSSRSECGRSTWSAGGPPAPATEARALAAGAGEPPALHTARRPRAARLDNAHAKRASAAPLLRAQRDHGDGAARVGAVVQREGAADGFDDLLADGEADAAALRLRRVEGHEEVVRVRDAW